MLAICSVDKPVVLKAPKLSSNAERVSQGTKHESQPEHKKHSTSLKQPSVSSKEETKGVTSKGKANPQLSSDSTDKAGPGLSTPNDSILQQQCVDEGTKNTLFDHISAGTDPYVLAGQTKSVSEGLETVLTKPITR
nr:hypothetical protein [Tanacetum cinerariifolium]